MRTKDLYSFKFLVKVNSRNRMAFGHHFICVLNALFCHQNSQVLLQENEQDFLKLTDSSNGQNDKNWRQHVAVLNLPIMLLFAVVFTTSSISFSQTNGSNELPLVEINNTTTTTIQSGLNQSYLTSLFDLDTPAVASWSTTDRNQALENRATNTLPRTLLNY